MSNVITDSGRRTGAYIKGEAADNYRSRDQVTYKAGAVYRPGQVVAIETATKKFVPLAAVAADPATGSENAAAICFDTYDASLADVRGVASTRDMEANGHELMWPAGITDNAKAAAIAALTAKGIVVRF